MRAINRLERLLIRGLRFVVGLLMVTAVTVNFANVVARYVFLKPFVWAEEAMQFMHIWIVLLGAAVLTSHGTHLKMDAAYIMASPKMRRGLDVFTNLLSIGVSAYVVAYSSEMISMLAATGQRSVIARVPMTFMYAVIPLGFGCGILLLLIWFIRLFRGEAPASVTRELAPPPEMTV